MIDDETIWRIVIANGTSYMDRVDLTSLMATSRVLRRLLEPYVKALCIQDCFTLRKLYRGRKHHMKRHPWPYSNPSVGSAVDFETYYTRGIQYHRPRPAAATTTDATRLRHEREVRRVYLYPLSFRRPHPLSYYRRTTYDTVFALTDPGTLSFFVLRESPRARVSFHQSRYSYAGWKLT